MQFVGIKILVILCKKREDVNQNFFGKSLTKCITLVFIFQGGKLKKDEKE